MTTLVNAYPVYDEDYNRFTPIKSFRVNSFENVYKYIYSFRNIENLINKGYLQIDKYLEENHTLTSDYFESENGKMGYWLYNPNLPKFIEQLPLIVSLHSGNGTGNDLNSLIIIYQF